MARPLRIELAAEADTPDDLIAALDAALRSFTATARDGRPDLPPDATDITVESSPHPLAGWRWRFVEDLGAPDPALAAKAAHIAAGGSVRPPPDPAR